MATTDRWQALDFGPPPSDGEEPESPVLVDHLADGRIALITLNRPHADNAITTEMGARLTEVVETIAVRPAIRVVVLTGAGTKAFSVGSDLRQRKSMTKEDWLRQRQAFDRTLYTLRELRTPILAAVNGLIGDVLALTGDSVDNIPGVGIGRKSAAALIREFGGLQPLLNNIDKVKSVRTREKLANAREQILQNRKMVDLDCEMELPVAIDELRIQPDYPALISALEKCEFKSLLQEVRDEAAKVGTVVQVNLL